MDGYNTPKNSNNKPLTPPRKVVSSHRRGFSGFTLAETLITLLVIGVVAALTIPALMQNINDYTLSKQRSVFTRKFDEGLKQMRVAGKLEEKYESSQAFVTEMGKYFKIAQVCDKDNLQNCFAKDFTAVWTYESDDGKITDSGAKAYSTTTISTTKSLDEKSSYNTDILGIKFTDGTNMLITYDPECTGIESGDTTGNATSCFGYVADVNAGKAPNLTEKDILTNMPLIHKFNLDFDIIGFFSASEITTPIFDKNTQNILWGGKTYCSDGMSYYRGAQKFCEDKGGRMISIPEITDIASKIYGEKFKPNQQVNSDFAADEVTTTSLWNKLFGTSMQTQYIYAQGSVYDSIGAGYYRNFSPTSTGTGAFVGCYNMPTICVK